MFMLDIQTYASYNTDNSNCLHYPVKLLTSNKDITGPSFSRNLRWDDTLSEDQGSGSRAIYNGGWVVLKCSANYHLCIFGLGLRGLWVLWAACQRWNRKEKCSWKRMRRLRAETSEIPQCRWSALYPPVYFSLPFLAFHVRKKKYLLLTSDVSSKVWTQTASGSEMVYLLHPCSISVTLQS